VRAPPIYTIPWGPLRDDPSGGTLNLLQKPVDMSRVGTWSKVANNVIFPFDDKVTVFPSSDLYGRAMPDGTFDRSTMDITIKRVPGVSDALDLIVGISHHFSDGVTCFLEVILELPSSIFSENQGPPVQRGMIQSSFVTTTAAVTGATEATDLGSYQTQPDPIANFMPKGMGPVKSGVSRFALRKYVRTVGNRLTVEFIIKWQDIVLGNLPDFVEISLPKTFFLSTILALQDRLG
jgi:hypothetical protein